jgi:4-amino-4-deoxy-L-arabinose transferase-like glycosyltransferase
VLRGLVLVLAAVFHVVTAGWSLIANGYEGEIAGAARLLLHEQSWLPTGTGAGAASTAGPLAVWLAKGSMNLFGVNEFGARLPTAIAVVVAVWLTIRLGELFGGAWRGFVAGMLLLCSPGMFTLGRTLTPAPLVAALVTASFYCLVRGFDFRSTRRQWFGLAWIAMLLCWFAGGWKAVAVPVGTIVVASVFFREARNRFSALFSWEGLLLLAIAAGVAVACGFSGLSVAQPGSPGLRWGLAPGMAAHGIAGWRVLCWQASLLFPWSLLLFPAAWAVLARLPARRPLEWAEAFPLLWLAAGVGAIFFFPRGSLFDSVVFWPAFALWGALRLEITPRGSLMRAMGVVFGLAVVALALTRWLQQILAWTFPAIADFVRGVPGFFWPSVTSVVFIAVLAFALFVTAAFWLELHHRRRFSVLALLGAMIPAGYAFADASAKLAPFFSYADIAHCIAGSRGAKREVAVDGNRFAASSLLFYLDPPFHPARLVALFPSQLGQPGPGEAASAFWQTGKGTGYPFLVTRRVRLGLWKAALGPGVRIVCESGGSVLLTNASGTSGPSTR